MVFFSFSFVVFKARIGICVILTFYYKCEELVRCRKNSGINFWDAQKLALRADL